MPPLSGFYHWFHHFANIRLKGYELSRFRGLWLDTCNQLRTGDYRYVDKNMVVGGMGYWRNGYLGGVKNWKGYCYVAQEEGEYGSSNDKDGEGVGSRFEDTVWDNEEGGEGKGVEFVFEWYHGREDKQGL